MIGRLLIADMSVIALACLIIVTEDTNAIDHQRQSVFVAMGAARYGDWDFPYHQFGKGAVVKIATLLQQLQQQVGFHVGNNDNA